MSRLILYLLLLYSSVAFSDEIVYNKGIKPNGMEEFAYWGLTARWFKDEEEGRVTKLCFFYMRRFVICIDIPLI